LSEWLLPHEQIAGRPQLPTGNSTARCPEKSRPENICLLPGRAIGPDPGKADNQKQQPGSAASMSVYKCPACGRSQIEIQHFKPTEAEAGGVTTPNLETEARCRNCGWFGSVEDLKTSY
jgi:DNA-directed RNA polymerase subunit RPC12/RpoP